jgi:hypothetical protein
MQARMPEIQSILIEALHWETFGGNVLLFHDACHL